MFEHFCRGSPHRGFCGCYVLRYETCNLVNCAARAAYIQCQLTSQALVQQFRLIDQAFQPLLLESVCFARPT